MFTGMNSAEELQKKILYTLGGKNLSVELFDIEIEMAIYEACILLSTRRPVYKTGTLSIMSGIADYVLASDCIAISSVFTSGEINRYSADSSPANVWRRTTKNFMMGTNLDNYINYYQSSSVVRFLAYINDQASVLGLKSTWRRIGNKIQFQPCPSQTMDVAYEYNYVRDFEELSPFEKVWVYKYVLGYCKTIVGEKRRKFGESIPLGIGDFKLNGDKLFTEGESLMKTQLEELLKIQAPLYPFFAAGV